MSMEQNQEKTPEDGDMMETTEQEANVAKSDGQEELGEFTKLANEIVDNPDNVNKDKLYETFQNTDNEDAKQGILTLIDSIEDDKLTSEPLYSFFRSDDVSPVLDQIKDEDEINPDDEEDGEMEEVGNESDG